MGQGTDRLSRDAEPRRLEHEIECLRADLDELVGELDRRRRQAGWIVTLVRVYARPLSVAGVLLLGSIALRIRAGRRRRRRLNHWQRRVARLVSGS